MTDIQENRSLLNQEEKRAQEEKYMREAAIRSHHQNYDETYKKLKATAKKVFGSKKLWSWIVYGTFLFLCLEWLIIRIIEGNNIYILPYALELYFFPMCVITFAVYVIALGFSAIETTKNLYFFGPMIGGLILNSIALIIFVVGCVKTGFTDFACAGIIGHPTTTPTVWWVLYYY